MMSTSSIIILKVKPQGRDATNSVRGGYVFRFSFFFYFRRGSETQYLHASSISLCFWKPSKNIKNKNIRRPAQQHGVYVIVWETNNRAKEGTAQRVYLLFIAEADSSADGSTILWGAALVVTSGGTAAGGLMQSQRQHNFLSYRISWILSRSTAVLRIRWGGAHTADE